MPWAAQSVGRSTPWGVPNSRSNRSPGSACAWGRNEKIPPPSLSTTTIVRSMPRSAAPSSPLVSCRKATSPTSSAVGGDGSAAAAARATPTAVDVTPSMPLAPRLARTRTSSRGAPYHSTSRTGIDDDVTTVAPGGTAASRSRATPGSVGSSWAPSTASNAACAVASAACHDVAHAGSGRVPTVRASAVQTAAGSACMTCAACRDGSRQAPSARHHHPRTVRRGQPLPHDLRCRRLTQLQDRLGPMAGGEVVDPQQGIGRRHDHEGAAHGSPSEGRRSPATRRPRPAPGRGPDRRTPLRRRSRPRATSSSSPRRATPWRSTASRCPPVVCHGPSSGRWCGSRPGDADERLAERQVEVDRTGAARPARRLGHRLRRQRTPGARGRQRSGPPVRRTTARRGRTGRSGRRSGAPRRPAARRAGPRSRR